MAVLIPLTSDEVCDAVDGGIYESLLCECTDITSVVYDVDNIITSFVMASVGAWVLYVYDDDDSAFYNQTGARTGRKFTVTGQASYKFSGLNNAIVQFANNAKDLCCVVAVHFLNSGAVFVQGLEKTATGYKTTKQKAKMTPSILTNTGADEDNATVLIDHVGKDFSNTTSMTSAEIQAL